MKLSDQSILSFYQDIATLDENHGVYLVQHTVSKRIFVKKILTVYNTNVFQYLKEKPVAHTPRIYELIIDDPTLIVIEEYITGRTLQQILDTNGNLSEDQALRIIEKICVILKDLHSASPSIIHRDIKPSNIILSNEGVVTLLDMNAAKIHQSEKKQDTRLIGTHGYAAPEQYGFGGSDVRTDIYSLGILLNVMLMGVLPKEKTASGFPGRIIEGCTRMEPKDRYASVNDILKLIHKYLGIQTTYSSVENLSLRSYLPPGFRSLSPIRMLIACIGYFLIFAVYWESNLYNENNTVNWIFRGVLLFLTCVAVFFSCNYRNIWNTICINQIHSRLIRFAVIAIIDIGIWGSGLIILIIISSIIS